MALVGAAASWVVGQTSSSGPVGRTFDHLVGGVIPNNIPDLEELQQMLIRGIITEKQFLALSINHAREYKGLDVNKLDIYTRQNGVLKFRNHPMQWKEKFNYWSSLFSRLWLPTPDVAIDLFKRKLIDDEAFDFFLQLNAVLSPSVRNTIKELQYEIPGSSDLIRFAVRDAFTPEIVKSFGYQNEFPTAILPWMEKQGYGQDTKIKRPEGIDADGNPLPKGNATWSDFYWWAHWELPSLTSGYEMFHRLYQNSEYGPSPDTKNRIFFSKEQLELLQKAQDIPVFWREKLQAVSYLPLTRVDVRRMHALKVLDDGAVYHAYRAIGYDDENAKNLLNFTKVDNRRKINVGADKLKEGQITKWYLTGVIEGPQAKGLLQKAGFREGEIDVILTNADLELQYNKITKSISCIKRSFYQGLLTEDEARVALQKIGVVFGRVSHYLSIWLVEREFCKKDVAARIAINWFKKGVINENELTARLQNLRHQSSDISRMVNTAKVEIQQGIQTKVIQATKQQQAAATKAQKEAIAEQRRRAAAEEKRINKILAAYTEKNLKEWWKLNLISPAEIANILRGKGWEEPAILDWLAANNPARQQQEQQNEA